WARVFFAALPRRRPVIPNEISPIGLPSAAPPVRMFVIAGPLTCPPGVVLMPRSRYRVDPDNSESPHFLTCTIVAWLPVFARPEAVDIVLNSWRFLQRNDGFTLFGYVI